MTYWFAAYVPAGTPAPVIARLNELLVKAAHGPAAAGFFQSTGTEIFTSTAEELRKFQTAESQKWGRIINVASVHGLVASAEKSAYVAAKHGIVGLTKVVALETAEEPITANAICPGYVLTPLVEAQIPDQMKTHKMDRETVIREVMLARQPSKQFATTGQIGGTVAFLCSPAADQITGTTISVDGGWTAL